MLDLLRPFFQPASSRVMFNAVARAAMTLLLFSALRVCFVLSNQTMFAEEPTAAILEALLAGLNYDAAALLTLQAPFLILASVPWPASWKLHTLGPRLARVGTAVVVFPFVWVEAVDMGYVRFTGRRSNLGTAWMLGDLFQQGPSLVLQFWPLALVALAASAVCLALGRWDGPLRRPWVMTAGTRAALVFLLGVPGVVAAIRGNVTTRPLEPVHAYVGRSTVLGTLAVGTTFSVLRSQHVRDVPHLSWLNQDQLRQALPPRSTHTSATPSKRNVMLLIVESLSLEFMGYPAGTPSYTPFLNRLAQRSLFLDNFFANGRRSNESIPSILASLPSLMETSYATSPYHGNTLHGLGEVLGSRGYATHFFHGGRKGSMFLDILAARCGVKEASEIDEYPHPEHFDGHWGIYDHYYLEFVREHLRTLATPFLAVVFTLSTHVPYVIPPEFAGRFPKGTLPIHEVWGYTDMALETFFKQVEQEAWYKDTIFVITGDHTADLGDIRPPHDTRDFRIPLMIFDPSGQLPTGVSHRVGHQADIFPTVLDVLGIAPSSLSFPPLPFGRSVLDPDVPGLAFNRVAGGYWLISRGWLAKSTLDGATTAVPMPDSPEPADPAAQAAVQAQLRALVQRYNNGLHDNSLYQP